MDLETARLTVTLFLHDLGGVPRAELVLGKDLVADHGAEKRADRHGDSDSANLVTLSGACVPGFY